MPEGGSASGLNKGGVPIAGGWSGCVAVIVGVPTVAVIPQAGDHYQVTRRTFGAERAIDLDVSALNYLDLSAWFQGQGHAGPYSKGIQTIDRP